MTDRSLKVEAKRAKHLQANPEKVARINDTHCQKWEEDRQK